MVYLLLIVALVIPAIRPAQGRGLEPSSTTTVNGLFTLLVFYRHVVSYRAFDGIRYAPMNWIDGHTGQFIVVGFLMFSGFGIMEGFLTQGEEYVRRIPARRILRTWIRFIMVVCLYLVLALFQGDKLSVKSCILAFLGWESLGNSNWYICVILMLYAITWIAFLLTPLAQGKGRGRQVVGIQCVLTAILIGIISRVRPEYWYNTMPAYVLGMWFSLKKEEWRALCLRHPMIPWLGMVLMLPLWAVMYLYQENILVYLAAAMLFGITMILVLSKFRLKSSVLYWLGRNLFGIYMMQRFCMILAADLPVDDGVFLAVSAGMTVILGWGVNHLSLRLTDNL